MRSYSWILPVAMIAAVDWGVRWEKTQLWNLREVAFYAVSILYLLAWGVLLRRLPMWAGRFGKRVSWYMLGLLAPFSGFVLFVHFSHYFYFGVHPSAITSSYVLEEPRETLAIMADQLTPARWMLLLIVMLLMALAWRMYLHTSAQRRLTRLKISVAVVGVVLLTPAFHNNVAMSQGNFLPSVNFVFSATKSIEFWLRDEGSYRRLQAGNRIILPTQPKPMPYDVLVIVSESLRAANLKYMGYARETTPRQDALFGARPQQSFVFQRCYANSTTTAESVPSVLTGVHPAEDFRRMHRLPLLFEYAESFPQTTSFLLTAHGYNVSSFQFFFQSQQLDHFLYQEISGHPTFNSMGMDDAFLLPAFKKILSGLTPEQRLAGILHLNSTHYPYRVPDGREKWKGRPEDDYDNSIVYQDELVGDVLDALRDADRLEHTIVIFTSDHGEGFGEHGVQGHRRTFYEELIHIPCWFYLPEDLAAAHGAALRASTTRNVSNVDLLPTLVDLLGLNADPEIRAITAGMWGQSLLTPVDPQRVILVQNGTANSQAFVGFVLVQDNKRFLYHQEGTSTYFGVFDLSADPYEQQNLWPLDPAAYQGTLQKLLVQYPNLRKLTAARF